jgi:hypothetical protein
MLTSTPYRPLASALRRPNVQRLNGVGGHAHGRQKLCQFRPFRGRHGSPASPQAREQKVNFLTPHGFPGPSIVHFAGARLTRVSARRSRLCRSWCRRPSRRGTRFCLAKLSRAAARRPSRLRRGCAWARSVCWLGSSAGCVCLPVDGGAQGVVVLGPGPRFHDFRFSGRSIGIRLVELCRIVARRRLYAARKGLPIGT